MSSYYLNTYAYFQREQSFRSIYPVSNLLQEVDMVLKSTQPIREVFLLLKFDETDEQTTQQLPAESSSNIFVYAIY